MSMPRLRNRYSGEREYALSLTDLREPSVKQQFYGETHEFDPYRALAHFGFDRLEAEYLIAKEIDGCSASELADRLGCDNAEVDRRRKRVDRKKTKLVCKFASENVLIRNFWTRYIEAL
jgi:hypothetical protein